MVHDPMTIMTFIVQVYAGLDYHAEPADIWSCGIVLVALLAGGVLGEGLVWRCVGGRG